MSGWRVIFQVFIGAVTFPWCLLASGDGDEFRVNTYVIGEQNEPAVAFFEGSRFIVVWESNPAPGAPRILSDEDGYSIRARLLNSEILPPPLDLNDFQVNSHGTGDQRQPQIAANRGDNFLVVWESHDGPSLFSVRGQLFSPTGVRTGDEITIDTVASTESPKPQVAIDPLGEFVVVWRGSTNIWSQRFNSDGTTQTSPLQVNTATVGSPRNPDVGINSIDGGFVVVWEDSGSIYGRTFDSFGKPIDDDDIRLNSETSISHELPAVTKKFEGNFAMAWVSDLPIPNATTIPATRRNQDSCLQQGTQGKILINIFNFSLPKTQPPDLLASPLDSSRNCKPKVVRNPPRMARQGDPSVFTVVWQGISGGATSDSDLSILARQFNSTGLLSEPIQINTNTTGPQVRPAVAVDSDGSFITVWGSNPTPNTDPDGFDLQGIDIEIVQTTIFSDGFESGSTLAWSVVPQRLMTTP